MADLNAEMALLDGEFLCVFVFCVECVERREVLVL